MHIHSSYKKKKLNVQGFYIIELLIGIYVSGNVDINMFIIISIVSRIDKEIIWNMNLFSSKYLMV